MAFTPKFAVTLLGTLLPLTLAVADEQPSIAPLDESGNRIIEQLSVDDLNRDGLLQPEEYTAEGGLNLDAMDPDRDSRTSREEYCDELLRQTDALEGKPLRRGAMQGRFDLECGDGGRGQIDNLPASRMDPDLN